MISYVWPRDVDGRAIRTHPLADDMSHTAARVIFYSNKYLCAMIYLHQLQILSSTPGYPLLRKLYIAYENPPDCSTASLRASQSRSTLSNGSFAVSSAAEIFTR